jgi:hypothetical protein
MTDREARLRLRANSGHSSTALAKGSAPPDRQCDPGQSPTVILPFQLGNKFGKRGTIPPGGKTEDSLMYTVVRSYFGKGAKELFDVLEKNKADVEKTLRSVKGFVSYTLVRSKDGGFSVTVCNDKAGTDESVEKARDWIAKNAAGTGVAAPAVSEGSNIFDLK